MISDTYRLIVFDWDGTLVDSIERITTSLQAASLQALQIKIDDSAARNVIGLGLREAIEKRTLGEGSVAGGEYLRVMNNARQLKDGSVKWVEVCYCKAPLNEERSYWEEYFEILSVQDAHERENCRDANGTEAWACGSCDCTDTLEEELSGIGCSFLDTLAK